MANDLTILEGAALGAGLKIMYDWSVGKGDSKLENTPAKLKSIAQCAIAGGLLAYTFPLNYNRIESSTLAGSLVAGSAQAIVTFTLASALTPPNKENLPVIARIFIESLAKPLALGAAAGCMASVAKQFLEKIRI